MGFCRLFAAEHAPPPERDVAGPRLSCCESAGRAFHRSADGDHTHLRAYTSGATGRTQPDRHVQPAIHRKHAMPIHSRRPRSFRLLEDGGDVRTTSGGRNINGKRRRPQSAGSRGGAFRRICGYDFIASRHLSGTTPPARSASPLLARAGRIAQLRFCDRNMGPVTLPRGTRPAKLHTPFEFGGRLLRALSRRSRRRCGSAARARTQHPERWRRLRIPEDTSRSRNPFR